MLGASQLPQQVGVKGQKLKREDEREESEERRGCWVALYQRLGRGQRHPAAQEVSPLPAPLPTLLQDMGLEVEGHVLPR